jgi:hypothetical protein
MRLDKTWKFLPDRVTLVVLSAYRMRRGSGKLRPPAENRNPPEGIPPTPRIEGLPGQTKMLSGMNAETIQLGASTISLILRSAATLHTM